MKKLFLLLALLGIVATGCSKDEVDKGNDNKTEQPNENEGGSEDNIPENIFFGLDKESVTISPDGGSVDVIVYSNYKWEISGTSDWCTPSAKSGDANEDGQKVTFSADTAAYDDREATFWFRCADKQIKFVVSQKSTNVIIYYTSSNSKIVTPYHSSAFGATIISNTYIDGVGVIEFNAPITTIGDWTFYGCSSLTSITIPNSVTEIGERAFEDCTSLTSVTIGDSVTEIGERAFEDCTSLTSVTIPDSVTTIGSYAFGYCSSLTSVTIGDSVTAIGDYAFAFCYDLTSVTVPDSVTTIGERAFRSCTSLTSVTIGDSVTTIGYCAFYDCSNLTSVTIGDSVTTIEDFAFEGCSSLTSVTIPDSVTTIGGDAFDDCRSLTSVYISDISAWCNISFSGSYSNPLFYAHNLYLNNELVTDLTIPDSVTTIGDYAFKNCISLTSVTIPDSVTTIGYCAFYDCSSLTSVTIPDSVTAIGDYAFYSCTSLTSVTIPDSVTTIGNSAFGDCSSLTEFKGKYASEDGRYLIIDGTLTLFAPAGLTEYTIPNSVTTIGEGAFSLCSSLTSITIPDSVTTIGDYAFAYCSSLTSVYCKAVTPPAGEYFMFYDNASGRKIYVPTESVVAYKSAEGWSYYARAIVGYEF